MSETETIVQFSGELDLSIKDELHERLDALRSLPQVVLDFSNVTYFDSCCVVELMRLCKKRIESGLEPQKIALSDGDAHLRRLLDICGVSKVCPIVRSADLTRGGADKLRSV